SVIQFLTLGIRWSAEIDPGPHTREGSLAQFLARFSRLLCCNLWRTLGAIRRQKSDQHAYHSIKPSRSLCQLHLTALVNPFHRYQGHSQSLLSRETHQNDTTVPASAQLRAMFVRLRHAGPPFGQ